VAIMFDSKTDNLNWADVSCQVSLKSAINDATSRLDPVLVLQLTKDGRMFQSD